MPLNRLTKAVLQDRTPPSRELVQSLAASDIKRPMVALILPLGAGYLYRWDGLVNHVRLSPFASRVRKFRSRYEAASLLRRQWCRCGRQGWEICDRTSYLAFY